MATKKQKREAAMAKHEHRMEELRRTGLEAQQKDRAHRQQKELDAWAENHRKNHSWKKRIKECPHCRIEMTAARIAEQRAS